MVVGIRNLGKDLFAAQAGTFYPDGITPVDPSNGAGGSGGRLLKACANSSGGFTIENNGQCGGTSGFSSKNFYNQAITHTPIGDHMGSVGVVSANQTILSTIQPGTNAGGIAFISESTKTWNLTSQLNTIYNYDFDLPAPNPLFGKANGLGDIEIQCRLAPIEIGNRVWSDTDNDGIQDAGEPGIAGVSVSLCTGNGTPIATATTDANGNYYFSNATGTNTTSAIYSLSALTANSNYQIKFPTTVGGKSLVAANTGADNIDSDASATGVVSFSTAGFGANDHTFDVGYSLAPCAVAATATPGACIAATNQYSVSGTISLTGTSGGVATITDRTQSTTISIGASATSVAYSLTGLTSGTGSHTITVSLPGCGTTTATYTAPASCTVAPCGLAMILTPGLCQSATNSYVLSGTLTATNVPTSGTLTITSGAFSPRSLTLPAGNASGTFSYSGLVSDGQLYTVTASYSDAACSPVSQTYTAPASCSVAPVCSLSATATAGLCATATNAYSASVVVNLTHSPAGTLTVSIPGTAPISQTLAANTGSFTAVFNGLPSDGASHTATISLPGCGTIAADFTAPASCSIAPVCSISAVATAGVCASATNTYSATAVVTIKNPSSGTLTISNGTTSQTFSTTAGSQNTFTMIFNGLVSDGASHTITASLPDCSTTITAYTAPVSCTACSLSLTTASLPNGQVGTAYNQTIATSGSSGALTFNHSGNLPAGLTLNTTSGVISGTPITAGTASFTITVTDAKNCSATVPLSILTYSAPVCSLTATVTPGTCSSATNQYAITGTVSATNATGNQSLTVAVGSASTVVTLTGSGPVSYTLSGLTSDGVTHTVSVLSSATACGSTSLTYTAPSSCTYACPAPVHVCKGGNYAIKLSVDDGQSSYQWYRNGVAVQGATASSYTATQAGSYSVVVNGASSTQCADGSCCPIVIVEDSVAHYQVSAQAPTCSSATSSSANSDGLIVASNWKLSSGDTTHYYYQVSLGGSFDVAHLVAGSATQSVPADGVLVANLPNPVTSSGQSYTVRITNGLGCSRDVVVNLTQTTCNCPPAKCIPLTIRRVR